MKAKSKFAYLLNAGGSLLSKEKIERRLHLPRKKAAPVERGEVVPSAAISSVPRSQLLAQEILEGVGNGSASKATQKNKSKMEYRVSGLTLMMERIARESRGERKTRQT